MTTPSKKKIALDFTLGGFFLACAITLRPYDLGNAFLCGMGLLWIVGTACQFDRHY